MQGVILTQGSPDRCIRVYTPDGFDAQAALFMSEPVTTRLGRIRRRAFFNNSYQVELDRQSRLLIPQALRDWAGLNSRLMVNGDGDCVVIWDADQYEAAMEGEEAEYLQGMESDE